MKKSLVAFILALFFLAPKIASAATYDWQAAPGVSFRMWIPDGVPVVKGFYYHFNESATDGRIYATKYRWQEWAKTMGFGIIGTYWTGNAPGGNTAAARQAMIQFASMSGHPEVANAPVLAEGISYGGATSVSFAATYPELTIAYLSGASGGLPTSTNPQFLKTPGLIYRGDRDPDLTNALKRRDEVIALRRQGAQVSYWIQWGFGHEFGYADDMGMTFLSNVVRLRYPTDGNPLTGPVQLVNIPDSCGWMADWTTWESPITYIDSYNNYTPGPANGFWLPNKDFAYVYRSHATKVLPITLSAGGAVLPNRNVAVSATVGSLTNVESVDFFDGAILIANDTSAPYSATWVSTNLGNHSIVAVANLNDGSKRTGYSKQVMVIGSGSPLVVGVPSSCNQQPPPPPPPVDASVPDPVDAGVCMCPCACEEENTSSVSDDFPTYSQAVGLNNGNSNGGCSVSGSTGVSFFMLSALGLIFVLRRRKMNG